MSKTYHFYIFSAGQHDVGIPDFSDEATVTLKSGSPLEQEPGEFEQFCIDMFKDWYDTPGVSNKPIEHIGGEG